MATNTNSGNARSTGFAIMRSSVNNDVIFFDAIEGLSESYSATLSKHPLASGSLVVDHSTLENLKFSMAGVLSDADFNLSRPVITAEGVNTTKQYINNTQTAYPVTITEKTSINRILPEVIAQFTKDTIPEPLVTPQEKVKTARAVKDELILMIKNRETFTFFEYDSGVVINSFDNCALVNLDFTEDATTGDGIFPKMQFEQVAFAAIRNVQVTIKNKGRVAGKNTKGKTLVDPATAPSTYSGKSALDYQGAGNLK